MSDIVNDFFRKFYPADWNTTWETRYLSGGNYGREYTGLHREARIFPQMECTDGFKMSVQGHFGAYSFPRDDFAGQYLQVEVLCPEEPSLGHGHACGDEKIYGYVPIAKVIEVIEKHGGLAQTSGIREP